MLIAVALSIAAAIRTFNQPVVKELGELDHTRNYMDRGNHQSATRHAEVLILRPEEPLFFASLEGVIVDMKARVSARNGTKTLVLSLEESMDIDSTAAECIVDFVDMLARHNIELLLARAKDPVLEALIKLAPEKFQDRFFWSVADAVACAQTTTSTPS